MYTLFIDTHYNEINIILFKGISIFANEKISNFSSTSEETMPAIVRVLKNCNLGIEDINKIAVVIGPGSFTGIRIGVTIAKVLAYANNIPIVVLKSTDLIGINIDSPCYIAIKEKNGAFITYYDSNDNEIVYYKNNDYEAFKKSNNVVENKEIDYLKLIKFINNLPVVNVHNVNPLYIKKIEALNDTKN